VIDHASHELPSGLSDGAWWLVNVTAAASAPLPRSAIETSVMPESCVVPKLAANLAGVQRAASWASSRLTKAW